MSWPHPDLIPHLLLPFFRISLNQRTITPALPWEQSQNLAGDLVACCLKCEDLGSVAGAVDRRKRIKTSYHRIPHSGLSLDRCDTARLSWLPTTNFRTQVSSISSNSRSHKLCRALTAASQNVSSPSVNMAPCDPAQAAILFCVLLLRCSLASLLVYSRLFLKISLYFIQNLLTDICLPPALHMMTSDVFPIPSLERTCLGSR